MCALTSRLSKTCFSPSRASISRSSEGADMRGVGTLAWVEMKLFVREPLGAFFTLIFPVLLLLIFGAVFGNRASGTIGDVGFVDAATPGYVALVIATSGLLSLAINVARARELGVL